MREGMRQCMREASVFALVVAALALGAGACDEGDDPADPPTPADDDDDGAPYDDADGDGVPDSRDRCPDTRAAVLTDARGCSARQVSGCDVTPVAPADGATVSGPEVTFEFDGDCDGYRVYASADSGLRPHAAHLLAVTGAAGPLTVDAADLPVAGDGGAIHWAVEGSGRGHTFLSEIRTLEVGQ